MLALFRRIFSYKLFPVCWTILIVILLCLPGSLVPGTGIFSLPNLDKYVHIFLFGTNVLLWGWHYGQLNITPSRLKQIIITDIVLTCLLGVALEYVQRYFIPNRSFDGGDIVADATGAAVAGIWLLWRLTERS